MLSLKEVKVISLDLDGTIVSKSFTDYFWLELVPELYSQRHNLPIDEAKRVVLSMYDEVGPDDIRWYLADYWFNRFDLKVSYKQVLDSIKHKVEVFPDALEVISKLCEKYMLILTTNASRDFVDIELKAVGTNYFKKVFSCVSDYGLPRKTEDFYLSICEVLSIKPSEMLHVGDDEKYDYQVPRSIGIQAYLVNRLGSISVAQHVLTSLSQLSHLLE